MDHIAIMKKSWNLIPKILSGKKTIESRWYKSRIAPWNKITSNDIIYFKNSGEKIIVKAEVSDVLQFENLNKEKIYSILKEYGSKIAVSTPIEKFESIYPRYENKRYCILIFLKNPEKLIPFNINKKGFGNACAWICIGDINKIKSK